MTEAAHGHATYGAYYSPKMVHAMQYLSSMVCGPNAQSLLVLFGVLILSFSFCVVLPPTLEQGGRPEAMPGSGAYSYLRSGDAPAP